ncbi:MAG: phytanoyl-CoA dioxygenase family protein [Gemmatimonadetes bacterium]|jgi:phytanoyl-CoA hydroxylase|nr:phytanoyl-CoA dioxygenase family protein [Gemmatimonadota bacterium]MDE0963147.1 phytanoyl-CoA dioxygenase family protein [Candidatus Latescibacterota bacterium]
MHTALTSEQIASYRENGYLAVDNLLDETELATWRQAVDQAVADTIAKDSASHDIRHNQTGEGYYQQVFMQCVNLWKSHATVKALVLDARIGQMAAEISGASGIRLFHDHALIKAPWANPTNFHVDNPMDPYHSQQATMLWIALDNATLQNGCLYFLPGSHRTSRYDTTSHLGQAGIGDLIADYPEWACIKPQPVEVKAGAGIFISGMVAHAAGPNMTLNPRRAFAMLFMPEDVKFNGQQSVLPDEVFNRLQIGDAINDDEHLPLLYSQDAPTP